MKRLTALFGSLLVLALFVLLPVKAAGFDMVSDGAGLLTDVEKYELNQLAMDITAMHKCEVRIMIVEDMGGDEAIAFASSVYQENGYGYGAEKSGLMLLLSMEERDYAIIAYGYGNTAFTDHGKDILADSYLLPLLGKNQYYAGFLAYLNKTAEFLEMAGKGTPFDIDTDSRLAEENAKGSFGVRLAATIFVPLLIAGIICLIFLRQMKTAVRQRTANAYIPEGGVNLTMRVDQFLYRTETRMRIETKSSGGGTTVGRGGFSGKSGKF